MAQPKKPVKEVEIKHKRGLDFNCSKALKLMRGYMTQFEFKTMIKNEKESQSKKKQKSTREE